MSFFQNLKRWLKKNVLAPEKKHREIQEIKERFPQDLFKKKVKGKPTSSLKVLKKAKAHFLPKPSHPFTHVFFFKKQEFPIVLKNWLRPQNLSMKSCIRQVILSSTRLFFVSAFGFADKLPSEESTEVIEKGLLEMNLFCYQDSGSGELTTDFIHYREDLSYRVYQYFDDMGYIGDVPDGEKKELLEFCRQEVKRAYADILMAIDFQLIV